MKKNKIIKSNLFNLIINLLRNYHPIPRHLPLRPAAAFLGATRPSPLSESYCRAVERHERSTAEKAKGAIPKVVVQFAVNTTFLTTLWTVTEATQLPRPTGAQRPTKQIIQTANMRKTPRIKYREEYGGERVEKKNWSWEFKYPDFIQR